MRAISAQHAGMSAMFVAILAAIGFLLAMLGVDVYMHDETLAEAWKGSPHQVWHFLGTLAVWAWQYKLGTLLVFGIVMAIVYIRRVPDVKAH
jgi:hypothetical protein